MLDVLFVYSSLTVDVVDDKYYNNALNSYIKRYRPLGNLTVCVSCVKCESSSQSLVDLGDVSIRFVEKENTIKKRFLDRSKNRGIIRELVNHSDLVIGHVPDSVAIMALTSALRLKKTCIAVAVGCPWDSGWNHSMRGKFMAPIGALLMRNIMGKVPYAMYVTQEFLQKRYPCPGITVGCSDVVMPQLDKKVLIDRLYKIKNTNVKKLRLVTSAAVDVRYKGQYDVIKAISLLRKQGYDLQYYLLGGGDNTYLRGIAEKYGVARNVHFLGMRSHEEVFSILDEMDVYVQSSRTEGLPRAVVEAIGRALPAIGTRVGGIPELLSPACLYNPGDVRALAGIISGFTHESLESEAQRNFAHAAEYARDVLDARREAFLGRVAQSAAVVRS